MSDECDSESVETCESRAKQSLSTSFFEILKQLSIEELNEPTRQWHCPACRNAPGAVVWYKGLKDLMHHVQTESSRVSHHRKLDALLEDPHGTSLLAAHKPFDNRKGLQKSSLCRPVAKPWCEAEYKRFRKLSSVLAMNCLPSLQGAGGLSPDSQIGQEI
ncbi:hypothetical protein GQ55_1G070300 [Panicum hallii var. hallii]|jgi:hypothetical protein|uniref:Zinc finger-XS domain-containing protein n=1 Tax=Panicum hallii var. hallii TaxID=1504633 RepID=A0A2T7F343_9POAL|nr:hypothetical protein GQ55_1G070300 [Panicum hallii var. hallii]